jgi:hypothetical protein
VKGGACLGFKYRAIAMAIDCHKCVHYYVTWDQYFPHGCRAMDFKSKRSPINDVRMAMQGNDCLAFELKKQKILHQDQRVLYKRDI